MAGQVVDIALARPAPSLDGLLGRYVGYRYEGFPPGVHRGLPSHHLTIVISLGAPVLTSDSGDPRGRTVALDALTGGLHTRPALIHHDGSQYGVQLELTPAGARSLFGVPAGALTGVALDLRDVLGPDVDEAVDRMSGSGDWAGRFAVLDEIFQRAAGRRRPADARLDAAWRQIVASGGRARVADVAAGVGLSRRHLTERFAAEYGPGPKDVGRIVRFDRSRWLLGRRQRPGLARVAADCGYYDQAHMAREWRDLAGCAPSAWLAERDLPIVQAETVPGARG